MFKKLLLCLMFTGTLAQAAVNPALRPPSTPSIDLMTNGGFEGRKAGWVASSPSTFTISTSSPLNGGASGVLTATGSGQTLMTAQYPIKEGLKGTSCAATLIFESPETTNFYAVSVVDGSSNVLGVVPVPYSVRTSKLSIPFLCPTSGTIAFKAASTGSALAFKLDDVTLGSNQLIQVGQASYYGGVSLPGGCVGAIASLSTSYQDVTFGSCASYQLLSHASAYADAGNGEVTFNSLPEGEYLATWEGSCAKTTASVNQVLWVATDGTKYSPAVTLSSSTAQTLTSPCTISAHFSYTGTGNRSFKIQAQGTAAETASFYTNGPNFNEVFSLYRFPSSDELAVKPETINWTVDSSIAGTNPSLGLSTQPTNSLIAQAGMSVSVAPNSSPVQIACSGTNPPTGSTCSAGTEQIGWAFQVPAAGKVKACATFSQSVSTTNGSVEEAFQLIETATNNDSTILQTGITSVDSAVNFGTTILHVHPMTLCSDFYFASAGQKVIRLAHASVVSGTIANNVLLTDTGLQGRNIGFTARPLTQNLPAPVLVFQPVAFHVSGSPTGSASGSYSPVVWGSLGSDGFDTNNAYNFGTGEYIVPVAGLWDSRCSVGVLSTYATGTTLDVELHSGASVARMYNTWAGSSTSVNLYALITDLKFHNVGDILTCGAALTVGTGTWSGDPAAVFFEGHLVR